MAKKKSTKDAYYFSHDSNAQRDEKITGLRQKYGWEGYGFFWAVVEKMSEATNYQLKHCLIKSIAYDMRIDENKLKEWLDDCITEYKLFESDGESYWSNSLKRRMGLKEAIRKAKSDAGKLGALAKHSKGLAVPSDKLGNAKQDYGKGKETKVNENKENKNKENGSKPNQSKTLSDNEATDTAVPLHQTIKTDKPVKPETPQIEKEPITYDFLWNRFLENYTKEDKKLFPEMLSQIGTYKSLPDDEKERLKQAIYKFFYPEKKEDAPNTENKEMNSNPTA